MRALLVIVIVLLLIVGGWFYFNQSEETANTNTQTGTKKKDTSQYNWSTMNEGPYRDKISFARSADILNWSDSEKVLAEHASVPDSLIKDGEIFLYFVDVSVDGIPEQIGLIRSKDNGSTWSDKVNVNFTGLGDKVPVDPNPVLLSDGRIRMFYLDMNSASGPEAAGTGATNKIYSAISTDGLNFTQEEGARFEYAGIFDPDVGKYGDTWYMYTGNIEGNKVILAVSKDGLDFTFDSIVYTGGAVPEVHFAFETFFLFTAGIDISSSQDGKTFSSTGSRFQSKTGPLTADPSVIVLDDMSYIMFYKTR